MASPTSPGSGQPGGLKKPTGNSNKAPILNQSMKEDAWIKKLLDAVENNNSDTVDELLFIQKSKTKDLKETSRDAYGVKGLVEALFAAIRLDRSSLAKRLIKVPRIDLSERKGPLEKTALHQAVAMNRGYITEILLERPDRVSFIDLGDSNDRTALHEAIYCDNKAAFAELLEFGASIDALDKQGMTPLHFAIWQDKITPMARKLASGYSAEVNTRDHFGKSPSFRI